MLYLKHAGPQNMTEMITCLKIKQEKIKRLESSVKKKSQRIGTEIVDDEDVESVASSMAVPRFINKICTLHEQWDASFGRIFLYSTNVRKSIFVASNHLAIFILIHEILLAAMKFPLRSGARGGVSSDDPPSQISRAFVASNLFAIFIFIHEVMCVTIANSIDLNVT